MEAGEIVNKINRKELRKQKLMEYLAAKGRLKPPNPKPYLRNYIKAKSTSMSTVKDDLANGKENQAIGKENQGPNALKMKKEAVKVQHLTAKAFSQTTGTLHSTTNKQSFTTSSSTLRPLSAASITRRLNAIKCAIKPSAFDPSHPAHLKIVPARPDSTVPTKTCPGTTNQPRTEPKPAVKTSNTCPNSAKPLANTGRTYSANTTRPQPNTTGKPTSTRSNTASTHRSRSSSARMSLSTVAKTKTGLMSAQVLPRNTHTRSTIPAHAAALPTTFVLNRACPSTIPVPTVTQRRVTTQRRTNPVTTVSKTNQMTGASAVENGQRRSQALSRNDYKPLPGRTGKPAELRQPVTGPKPTIQNPTGLPGSMTAAIKPGEKGKNAARVSIQVVEPVKRAPPQHTAEARGAGGATTRICKPVSQASAAITVNQCQAKALSRAMHAAVAKIGQKGSIEENRETTTETNAPSPSINAPTPVCWPNRSTVNSVWIPQTVPRSARESIHGQLEVGRGAASVGMRTPRDQARIMPQTEGRRKMTAAQEERMQKLHEWRENRGISYKRPPMPMRPPQVRRTVALPQPYWAGMEDEDLEAKSLVGAVDRFLADCIKLLNEGCLSTQVQEMLSRVPMAEKFSKYWICQARLMERQGNLDVLPLFEEAVRVVLEPVDELRTVVFEMLKKKEETQGKSPVASEEAEGQEEKDDENSVEHDTTPDPMATPATVKALIRGDRGESSVVKYKITATPGGFRSQQRELAVARVVDGQELRFFTPIRRSVRIERSALRYPVSLQEHDLCVASFNDLMAQEEERAVEREGDGEDEGRSGPTPNGHLYVYRENEALRDQVNIQLLYAEED